MSNMCLCANVVSYVAVCHNHGNKWLGGVDRWMLVERGKGGRGGEEGKGGNGLETRECGSVPLITGSSWIIVSVTESNQGQIDPLYKHHAANCVFSFF